MVSKKMEYDNLLGGSVVLGTHMPTYKYAAAALEEMKDLINSNNQCNSNNLVFQTLPKHMRRRAMSHHPKRLPRKYRAAHIHQMTKSGKPQVTKRPSRKHRRRPKNLLKEYLRRQRKYNWLETHIWHAKRFHMIERWGYKLPYASCDKTYRACYRATVGYCLLQDISFYVCVEMKATLYEFAKGFDQLTSKKCGLSLTANTFINGRREGSIDLFKAGKYPYGALGKATFLWKYVSDYHQNNGIRTLWLWFHPAAYNTILEEMVKVFELKLVTGCKKFFKTTNNQTPVNKEPLNFTNSCDNSEKYRMEKRQSQYATKCIQRHTIPHYSNKSGSVELRELKKTLNRFRLTGHSAQSILYSAFNIKSLDKDIEKDISWAKQASHNNAELITYHMKQQQFWAKCNNSITSPDELLSNMVLGLNIKDPRISRPQKRTKAVREVQVEKFQEYTNILLDIQPELSFSALWCDEVRNRVAMEMLSTHDYCSLRAKNAVVPGKPCSFEENMQPVPIILIQRPGSQNGSDERLGYGCGWDIIAPAGYGLPLWSSLIMWGARPGGLRELNSIAREMGTEEHLPDTVVGIHNSSDRYNELISKYFRLPPNKRCNYRKFAIASPFRIPFHQLVRDWSPTNSQIKEKQFFVLRELEDLKHLADCVKKCRLNMFPSNLSPETLIQVKITMKSRGNPKDYSVICLPNKKDLTRNLKQMMSNDRGPVFMEPLLPDSNETQRNRLRMQHKRILKRLRAKRIREKRKKQETSCTKVNIRPAGTSVLCLEQFKKICELWLPPDVSTLFSVRKQGNRDCFGYVSSSKFCFTKGVVRAIGYVTVEGLKNVIELCQQCHLKQTVCLIRSADSRNYRFATVHVNSSV